MFHCLFQRLLELFRRHHSTVGQRHKAAGLGKSGPDQLLYPHHILFQTVHSPRSFPRSRRSVGEVVIASYSFCVAWKAMGT